VAGYCIGLDITVRGPEERACGNRSARTLCLGLVAAVELADPSQLATVSNGEIRQLSNTRAVIMGMQELIAFRFYTLMPSDVPLTRTPEGVDPIKPEGSVLSSISSIGV